MRSVEFRVDGLVGVLGFGLVGLRARLRAEGWCTGDFGKLDR